MTISNGTVSRSLCLGAVLAFAGLAALVPGGVAQTPVAEGGDGPHPAHIHTGTCGDGLGEVVLPLTDVAMAEGEHSGADTVHAIKSSHTVVDAPLQDIIDGGHAINVHLSAEEIGTYIACGNIGGVVFDDDGRMELTIALGEIDGSGHVGIAWLGAEGDQTEVAVTLIEPESME
ncbi:MAG: hypothetical protein M3509_09530 [Chloroflexota bacterium]|nr:hypothetical protein [Chloroflexota bacterium]